MIVHPPEPALSSNGTPHKNAERQITAGCDPTGLPPA
jgi:hypothetical protein